MPPSAEVLEHRWRQHDARCLCLRPPTEDPCPCGASLLLRCGCCAEPLFLVLPEDLGPCGCALLGVHT